MLFHHPIWSVFLKFLSISNFSHSKQKKGKEKAKFGLERNNINQWAAHLDGVPSGEGVVAQQKWSSFPIWPTLFPHYLRWWEPSKRKRLTYPHPFHAKILFASNTIKFLPISSILFNSLPFPSNPFVPIHQSYHWNMATDVWVQFFGPASNLHWHSLNAFIPSQSWQLAWGLSYQSILSSSHHGAHPLHLWPQSISK